MRLNVMELGRFNRVLVSGTIHIAGEVIIAPEVICKWPAVDTPQHVRLGHTMTLSHFSRRRFLSAGALAAVSTASASFGQPGLAIAERPLPRSSSPAIPSDDKLDAYIAAYMPVMNAPGLTLGLTDATHTLRTAGYGYANVEEKTPLTPAYLFQIGSITKSFVALVLLQLRDEGKLDLHKPVLNYLPWLPIREDFGPITIHHLLTHTSGLPDNLSYLSSDPQARLIQGFKPGEHFHYCNAAFTLLGELAVKLSGKPWHLCVQERILTPLEMTDTSGVITNATRSRAATGYQAFWEDQVYPRQGKLVPSSSLVMDDTAGCVTSTPADMARYARMLLNRGQGPKSRIVSEESFTLFSTPYIKAEEFSPTASYGYGIAVDTLDGHKILRHTGGMVAFASSIHVDLDGGVAAFASINAMQGYRPTAVTEYAVRLLSAAKQSKPLPELPSIADPMLSEHAAQYAGTFHSSDGQTLEFTAEGTRLSLTADGHKIPLQPAGSDRFISTVEGAYANHTIVFGRAASSASGAASTAQSAPQAAVVEVSYGSRWYVNSAYTGPRSFTTPPEYAAYVGHYYDGDAWGGELRVYVLKDKLFAGDDQLTPIGGNLFRPGDESWTPETAEFLHIFDGKAKLLKLAGMDFWRVEVD